MSQVAPRQPQDEPAAAAAVAAAAEAATAAAAKHARSAHRAVVTRTEYVAYTKLTRSRQLLPHEVAEDDDGDDAALLLLFLLLLLLPLPPLAARQWNRKFSTQLKLLHAHTHTHTGTLAYAYTGEERRAPRLSPLMSAPNVVLWFLSRRRVLLRLRLRLRLL